MQTKSALLDYSIAYNVLSFLNTPDLFKSCLPVCTTWRDIILNIDCCISLTKSFHISTIEFLIKKKLNVHVLELSEMNISSSQMSSLLKKLPRLLELRLISILGLQELDLEKCVKPLLRLQLINNKFLEKITFSQKFSELKYLSVVGCTKLKISTVQQLIQLNNQLFKLELVKMKELDAKIISSIAPSCTKLESLSCRLSGKSSFGFTQSKLLQRIDFSKCKITDKDLDTISKTCKDLLTIKLWGCNMITDEGVKKLVNGCPLLNQIDFSCCNKITDISLQEISKTLKNLTMLQLWWCTKLGKGIKHLRNLTTLMNLNLNWVTSVDDDIIEGLAPLKSLTTFMLAKCSKITTNGLKKISEQFRELRQLDLTECSQIDDEGVIYLAKNCRDLDQVAFTKCKFITDRSICELTKYCKKLEGISIAFTKCTIKSIESLNRNCKNLQVLDVTGCGISHSSVIGIQLNPNLTIRGLVQ